MRKIKQFYLTRRWEPNSTTTPGQSRPESNGNEEVIHIPQTPRLQLLYQMQDDSCKRKLIMI